MCSVYTMEKVRKTVSKLKNGKAAGEDDITGEMLKANDETALQDLLVFFNGIWNEEKNPTHEREAHCNMAKEG